MTEYLPRSAWTDVGPAKGMPSLDPARVLGFAIHWPGTTAPITNHSRDAIARRLEGYRRHHVSVRGWSDIAYQVAVDAEGRVWDLRGIRYRSAGNGSTAGNTTYGAILLLLGPGDPITDAMRNAVVEWRRDKWLARYPGGTEVVGHRDIRPEPTECPGPAAQALVNSRAFTKGTVMTPDQWRKLTREEKIVRNPESKDSTNPVWPLAYTLEKSDAKHDETLAILKAQAETQQAVTIAIRDLANAVADMQKALTEFVKAQPFTDAIDAAGDALIAKLEGLDFEIRKTE